jgi:D-alanine transaminase
MSRIVYVNGSWVPEAEAKVSVFDRGFLMGDAVYEVTSVVDGKLLDFAGHCARLERSTGELGMKNPHTAEEWLALHREIRERNSLTSGLIYLQVSRGNPGDRDFAYPDASVEPTVVMFTQEKLDLVDNPVAQKGLKVISVPEMRWHRRDIKTVQLLYPSMAKMAAKAAGKDDAWFVEDGFVTEGTSNNTWIVKGGKLITRQLSTDLLHGITRASALKVAADLQLEVEERPYTIEEAQNADEAFITSAGAYVLPVVEVDGVALGAGTPGPIARRMREVYIAEALKAGV